ncbi:MAG: PKD domain-containing protein [Bacteroidia bacterium]|nr:PKD domain-containing protein [Bacteroidia bacterium]
MKPFFRTWALIGLCVAQGYFLRKERHSFVGTAAHEIPTCAVSDPDGHLFIGGYQSTSEEALSDGWIVGLSPSGEMLWSLSPGGMGPDRIEDLALADSVLYFCGVSGSSLTHPEDLPVNHRADFWVGAVDKATGRLLWQSRWGSPHADAALTLCLTPYRTLLVGGYTWEEPEVGLQAVIYVVQARTGEILQRRLWGAAPSLIRRIRSVPGSTYYACVGEQGFRPFVSAIDYLGQIYWRTVFQFHRFPSQLLALYPTAAGQILVGGRYGDRWGVSALDLNGRVIWEKAWPEDQLKGAVYSLSEGPEGVIYALGCQFGVELISPEQRGGEDMWIAALQPGGKLLWERAFGGPQDECGVALLWQGQKLLLVAAKENRFVELLRRGDAWLIWLQSISCEEVPVEIKTDVPSLREKAGRPIRFWLHLPPSYTEEEVRWDFGDGATAVGKEVSHIFAEPGIFTVQAVLSLRYGCRQVYLPPVVLRISRP